MAGECIEEFQPVLLRVQGFPMIQLQYTLDLALGHQRYREIGYEPFIRLAVVAHIRHVYLSLL